MMGTLNTDLLSKDTFVILNNAAALMTEYGRPSLMPELILLALLQKPDTAAARMLDAFKNQQGLQVDKLEKMVKEAVKNRREAKADLDFIASENVPVPLSKMTIILIDDALSLANDQNQMRVDTDHLFSVLTEASMPTSGLLRQHGITHQHIQMMMETIVPYVRKDGTIRDFLSDGAATPRHVYLRQNLLKKMVYILSQVTNRHIILLGPDGVGKRTLVYSLALQIAEGKLSLPFQKIIQIDETALLDNDQKAVRAGLSQATNGILFIPHLHRFFGGPIRAEFNKSGPLIQKTFLSDDPVLIGMTTEAHYIERMASLTAITENCQIIRVPQPSPDETLEILKALRPEIEDSYALDIRDDTLKIVIDQSRYFLPDIPLPRRAEQLIYRAAAALNADLQPRVIEPGSPRPNLKPDDIMKVIEPPSVSGSVIGAKHIPAHQLPADSIFVSYSRVDWENYVNPLVNRLRADGLSVWVDQYLLEGGDDWLDEINLALERCSRLILCVSPEALASRYVKMEYRKFYIDEKIIVPLICREAPLPAELLGIQYLPYEKLNALISLLKGPS